MMVRVLHCTAESAILPYWLASKPGPRPRTYSVYFWAVARNWIESLTNNRLHLFFVIVRSTPIRMHLFFFVRLDTNRSVIHTITERQNVFCTDARWRDGMTWHGIKTSDWCMLEMHCDTFGRFFFLLLRHTTYVEAASSLSLAPCTSHIGPVYCVLWMQKSKFNRRIFCSIRLHVWSNNWD